jgi:hypothetical protein
MQRASDRRARQAATAGAGKSDPGLLAKDFATVVEVGFGGGVPKNTAHSMYRERVPNQITAIPK